MSKFANLLSVFVKVGPRLQAVARARTRCRMTAEDVLQETWLKLEHAHSVEQIDNPGGFITQIANNTISGHLRKERRRAQIDGELASLPGQVTDDVSPERVLIGRENLKAVRDALAELPDKTRRIFLMNRIERISHRKIAQAFGITDEAVYYHIRRALERLAQLRDELND